MKNTIAGLLVSFVLGLAFSSSASAALIDRGKGMIYDSTQNITWLQDANYAYTSGYAAANQKDGNGFDDVMANGLMGWDAAMAWADGLIYGGYDDWRLFKADAACPFPSKCYNNTVNELGHLFYVDLGLKQGQSILSSTDPDLGLFTNLYAWYYWSGTGVVGEPKRAWNFLTQYGQQNYYRKDSAFFAWAVRSGDVAAVPEPGTLLMLSMGLVGMAGARWRRG